MRQCSYATVEALAFVVVCMHGQVVAQDPNGLAAASWKVGDSWTVQTWYARGGGYFVGGDGTKAELNRKAVAVNVRFDVTRVVPLDEFEPAYLPSELEERVTARYKNLERKKYKCFEVQLTYPKDGSGFQRRCVLYFREDLRNLIRVRDTSIRTNGSVISMATDYCIEPNGPVIDSSMSLIPLDWPVFDKETIKQEKDFFFKEQEIKEKKVKDAEGREYSEYEVVISKKAKKGESQQEVARCEQKWKKGDPWWSEAKRYEDGKLITEAVLIRE